VSTEAGANRKHWSYRNPIRLESRFYGVEDIRRDGPQFIVGSDEEEVGDVEGKRFLTTSAAPR
jgi:hypothetical protein